MDEQTHSVLMSSSSEEWGTPPKLFDWCNLTYGPFTIDLAASEENTLVRPRFYTKADNALVQDWTKQPNGDEENGWLNCPYGKGGVTGRWVKKAYDSTLDGAKLCILIPARTDTAFFHDYIFPHTRHHFIRGRLQHIDWRGGERVVLAPAPFPSVIAVFDPKYLGKGHAGPALAAKDFR